MTRVIEAPHVILICLRLDDSLFCITPDGSEAYRLDGDDLIRVRDQAMLQRVRASIPHSDRLAAAYRHKLAGDGGLVDCTDAEVSLLKSRLGAAGAPARPGPRPHGNGGRAA